MVANPKPDDFIPAPNTHSPIIFSDSNRPNILLAVNFFETNPRVRWVAPPELIRDPSLFPDIRRQCCEEFFESLSPTRNHDLDPNPTFCRPSLQSMPRSPWRIGYPVKTRTARPTAFRISLQRESSRRARLVPCPAATIFALRLVPIIASCRKCELNTSPIQHLIFTGSTESTLLTQIAQLPGRGAAGVLNHQYSIVFGAHLKLHRALTQ